QRIRATRKNLRQSPPLRVVLAANPGRAEAVMGFIDDRQIPGGTLQIPEDVLLLGEIQGGQAERGAAEWIAPQFKRGAPRAQRCRVGDRGEAKPEPMTQFLSPLRQQGTGRGDDNNAMGAPSGDQ